MGSQLEGRVGLVTGAGSGVGREMARLFAEHGCKVVAVDVVPERVNQVVSEIGASGGKATGMVLDLSLKSEVEKMVEDTFSAHGKIDILCNNAGIMDGVKPVAETSDELWERVLGINLNAPFWASRRVVPDHAQTGKWCHTQHGVRGWTLRRQGGGCLHGLKAWPHRAHQEHRRLIWCQGDKVQRGGPGRHPDGHRGRQQGTEPSRAWRSSARPCH